MVYPSNVIHMATECYNQQHSAVFPVALPEWFIKLFTEAGDMVLDPFAGSGTTCVAAKRLERNYLGIDINPEYCELARERIEKDLNGKTPPDIAIRRRSFSKRSAVSRRSPTAR